MIELLLSLQLQWITVMGMPTLVCPLKQAAQCQQALLQKGVNLSAVQMQDWLVGRSGMSAIFADSALILFDDSADLSLEISLAGKWLNLSQIQSKRDGLTLLLLHEAGHIAAHQYLQAHPTPLWWQANLIDFSPKRHQHELLADLYTFYQLSRHQLHGLIEQLKHKRNMQILLSRKNINHWSVALLEGLTVNDASSFETLVATAQQKQQQLPSFYLEQISLAATQLKRSAGPLQLTSEPITPLHKTIAQLSN